MSNLDSAAAAVESGAAERESTAASVPALNGTPKRKRKKTKKKDKVQEQESPPDMDSMVAAEAEEQEEAKGRGMEGQEAADAAASCISLNVAPKCNNKKMKRNKLQEQQESPPDMNSTAAAEAEEQEEAKGRGIEGQEDAAAAAASCISLNVTPKCKKKKKMKRNKLQEQQEFPPDMNSTAAAEVEEQGEPKGNGMEEPKATDAAAFALNGTPKCNKKKTKKNNKMQEQQEPPLDLDSAAAAEAEEQGEAKGRGMEERKDTDAAASVLEGTRKCDDDDDEAKVKDSVTLKEEATGTVVSASEGTAKRSKRKRKNKMQEQPESKQASPGVVGVNNKSENGCTDGIKASGHADVNMDPINANIADVLIENCSENSSLLQESSAGRKRRKRKRNRGSSSRGPKHGLSCICGSCLVGAHKEKIKNIYSPRGSLVRFQRKKLLILDLNGLLADINTDTHNAHKAHGKVRDKLVFKRPYCDDFLRFCFENFELGIWSSRKRENVATVVNMLMRTLKPYLLFCWNMSHCTITGCNTIGNKHKPLVLKELKKLWDKEEPTLPWEQGEFSPSNTLLVDDSPYKALCNPPNTAIFPQPYSYRNERDDNSLGPDGDLRNYLERIASADNVQSFIRDNPFGQNSITESDPNWKFYVQIVDKVKKVEKILDKAENK